MRLDKNEQYGFIRRLYKEHHDAPRDYILGHFEIGKGVMKNWRRAWREKRDYIDFQKSKPMEKDRYDELKPEFVYEYTLDVMPKIMAIDIIKRHRERGLNKKIYANDINEALSAHFNKNIELPGRTLWDWSNGCQPDDVKRKLINEELCKTEFSILETELTATHWRYHYVREAVERNGAASGIYRTLMMQLGEPYDRLRGWVYKGNGHCMAKSFRDNELVDEIYAIACEDADKTEAAMRETAGLGRKVYSTVAYAFNLKYSRLDNTLSADLENFVGHECANMSENAQKRILNYSIDQLKASNLGFKI